MGMQCNACNFIAMQICCSSAANTLHGKLLHNQHQEDIQTSYNDLYLTNYDIGLLHEFQDFFSAFWQAII